MTTEPGGAPSSLDAFGPVERHVIDHLLHRTPVARNSNETYASKLTFGERVADRVAALGGSWSFIALFLLAMSLWMLDNVRDRAAAFDPYPFILLNLVLSCLAALQAPVIMMSQRRQSAKDRVDAQHDYEVNLKTELEIVALHLKIDSLKADQWNELLAVQARQIALLERLLAASPAT